MPKTKGKSPRRRGVRAETHERLVRAALELLHAGGEAAVSTVSVTRGAGIVQSAFYKHFRNVADCLAAVAGQAADDLRAAVAEARRAMYGAGPEDGKALEDFYRTVFTMASERRSLMELFLRHRGDPLALCGVMRRLERGLAVDLARDLTEAARRGGLTGLPPDWVEGLADNLIGASLSAVEASLEGRGPGPDESARLLAAFTNGACMRVIEALSTKASPHPADALPKATPRNP